MSGKSPRSALYDKCSLLGLAEELQVAVLLDLGAGDILACTKVCHALADVVKRTPAVQYKLELGLAAMVDGPAKGVPVPKRLEQLRAYQAAWRENDIPVQTAMIPYNSERPYFKLLRPASSYSGITEERKTVDCKKHPPSDTHIEGCAVDHTQDLLVVTQLELGERSHMWILSMSQDGMFHPLAAKPHFESDEELSISVDPEERLEICGDLIAWTVATDTTDIIVLNWKTGVVIWRSGEWHDGNQAFYMRCHFLDPTHLLIVENTNLHIHEVDASAKGTSNVSYGDALCTLKLPALAGRKGTHAMESDLRFPPVYPGCEALFQRDPQHTLLAVRYSVCDDPMGYSRTECKSFLALVPVSTLFAQLQRARTGTKDSSPTNTRGRVGGLTLEWEDWSPLGARIVEIKLERGFDIFALGSQCLIIPRTNGGLPLQAERYLFDAHPLAKDAPHARIDLTESAVRISDSITDPGWFVRPVHSNLPYRIAHKIYSTKTEPGAGYASGPRYISHDGLLGTQNEVRKR